MCQSNDNADNINQEDRFKFVDDLTALEILNLLITQVTSYDFFSHVASDIPTHNGYIDKSNLQSQKDLNLINTWTKKKRMILNQKKTKNIIYNFTKNLKFTTRMNVNNENIEAVQEVKLLGTILTNDLKWKKKKHDSYCK